MKPFEKWWESSSYDNQNEVAFSFSHNLYSYYSLELRESYDIALQRRLPQGEYSERSLGNPVLQPHFYNGFWATWNTNKASGYVSWRVEQDNSNGSCNRLENAIGFANS